MPYFACSSNTPSGGGGGLKEVKFNPFRIWETGEKTTNYNFRGFYYKNVDGLKKINLHGNIFISTNSATKVLYYVFVVIIATDGTKLYTYDFDNDTFVEYTYKTNLIWFVSNATTSSLTLNTSIKGKIFSINNGSKNGFYNKSLEYEIDFEHIKQVAEAQNLTFEISNGNVYYNYYDDITSVNSKQSEVSPINICKMTVTSCLGFGWRVSNSTSQYSIYEDFKNNEPQIKFSY